MHTDLVKRVTCAVPMLFHAIRQDYIFIWGWPFELHWTWVNTFNAAKPWSKENNFYYEGKEFEEFIEDEKTGGHHQIYEKHWLARSIECNGNRCLPSLPYLCSVTLSWPRYFNVCHFICMLSGVQIHAEELKWLRDMALKYSSFSSGPFLPDLSYIQYVCTL